jgi:Mce-associated membrane protein
MTWRSRPVLAMLLGAVVLAAAGIVLLALGPRHSSGPSNRAVVDRTATAEVIGQVDTALQRVLSYKYNEPTATKTAAQQVLVGAALKQYNVLFAALQKKASGQQLTLTAKVVTAGVTFLQGNRAQLLVFLDQTSTRASDGKTSASAAQLQISAQLAHGTWQISNLVPL